MSSVALISIFGPDRTGLVAAVTGCLFDLGANLGDTGFSIIGAGAEFSSVCELPDGVALDQVASDLAALPELAEAEVTVRPFALDPTHGRAGEATHHVTVSGGDQPGLIARLCETFVEFNANIVALNAGASTGQDGSRYIVRMSVAIPADTAPACLATVSNTAQNLRLHCHWETA